MSNWRQIILSGSDAKVNSLFSSTSITGSTGLQITGESTFNGQVDIYKSGSTVLDIQGSQGQLFSITDSLSGSLMSVNDISGLPILEVFSDNTVKIGTFNDEAIIVNGNTASITGSLFGTSSYSDNSELLGNLSSSQFLRSDESDTMTGNLTVAGNISGSGDLNIESDGFIDGTLTVGTLIETSKRELKENIYPITSQLENILKLNPVSFNFNGQEKTHFGFIVDEVEPIYPEFISDDENGINYSKMVSVLVKVVQELKQEIDDLKEELKELKK